MEALRHPWLEDVELRLAYGQHLAARGDSLGEWIAASTRLAEPEGLSLEEEWELRQRAWSLLDAHGESWTQGKRSNRDEFEFVTGHRWRLDSGRFKPCPWELTPELFRESTRAEFEARGEPHLAISPQLERMDLAAFANHVAERPWLRRVHSLEVRLTEEWTWTEADELAAKADYEAFCEAREVSRREAKPPVNLRAWASLLPGLRDLRLGSSDFLRGWSDAFCARLEAFSCAGNAADLADVLARTWPRLRRLQVVGDPLSPDPEPCEASLDRLPKLSSLTLSGIAPKNLGEVASQLEELSLAAPLPMMLGGPPQPALGLVGPLITSDLRRLRSLTIYSHQTSASVLSRLASLPLLRTLELSNTGLNSAGARVLADLEGLRSLTLGCHQPLGGRGLSELLIGPLHRTLRELDVSGGHGAFGARWSHYPLAGAEALHACRTHGLVSLKLSYLTRRSARVLATAPALRRLCKLGVTTLRDDPQAIYEALNQRSVFRLTHFEVEAPKSNAEEATLRDLWGWRYVHADPAYDFDFTF